MSVDIRLLRSGDERVLENVAADVFDHRINPALAAEFLADPRHHLVVAIDGSEVVGFASAVHYVHPDKPRELWINELGVAPSHQRQGIGRRLLETLLDVGRERGCRQAWVLTEPDNLAALRTYEAAGGKPAGPTVMLEFSVAESEAALSDHRAKT